MFGYVRQLHRDATPTADDYNKLARAVNRANNLRIKGAGVRQSISGLGTNITINPAAPPPTARGWHTWKILAVATSDAAGGNNDYSPYYRCQEQIVDNASFNTAGNSDVWAATGLSDLIVCNVSEIYPSQDVEPALIPSDLLFGYEARDNAGTVARVGYPEAHKHVRWAKTTEPSQGNEFIEVQLLKDDNINVVGNAFDAKIVFVDAAIANGNDADECTPQIVSGAIIRVSKVGGRWYAYITMTYMDICP